MKGNLDENKIREAFEEVRLPEGAKDRMYANILRKAELAGAESEESSESAVAPPQETEQPVLQMPKAKKPVNRSWRKYASLAACLVIFVAAGAFLPGILDGDSTGGGASVASPPASENPVPGDSSEYHAASDAEASQDPDSSQGSEGSAAPQTPQTGENSPDDGDLLLSPSPFDEVTSADEFSEKLGFSIDAPADADGADYSIAFGETAIVDFRLGGHSYAYYASKNVDNISSGDDSEGVLSKAWKDGDVNYLLSNSDGASKDEFEKVASALQNS